MEDEKQEDQNLRWLDNTKNDLQDQVLSIV